MVVITCAQFPSSGEIVTFFFLQILKSILMPSFLSVFATGYYVFMFFQSVILVVTKNITGVSMSSKETYAVVRRENMKLWYLLSIFTLKKGAVKATRWII